MILNLLLQADPITIGEILYIVGTAVGAPAHIAQVAGGVVVGGAALCGTSVTLIGLRCYWVGQIGCDDCRREWDKRQPSVDEMD